MKKTPRVRTHNRWVYAAPSSIHGRGLFARVDIPSGTDLVEYEGLPLSAKEGRQKATEGNVYIFAINRRESIDGDIAWNLGRHANHSCEPNAKSLVIKKRVWLRALKPIPKGREISYDYGFSFRDDPTPCHCHSPSCRGVINSPAR